MTSISTDFGYDKFVTSPSFSLTIPKPSTFQLTRLSAQLSINRQLSPECATTDAKMQQKSCPTETTIGSPIKKTIAYPC
ncbi:MAG TPA: hypothetical protein ENN22_09225 [bacterium]|nr:hypothetical protein [bacterium]